MMRCYVLCVALIATCSAATADVAVQGIENKAAGAQTSKTAVPAIVKGETRGAPIQEGTTPSARNTSVSNVSHTKPKEEKPFWHSAMEAASLVVTAAATVFLAIFTYRLWWSTNKLWEESKAATKIANASANAATKGAEAAERAAENGRAAFIAAQRPWVSAEFSLADGLKLDDNGLTISMRFVLQNTGQSPALRVSVDYAPYLAFGENVNYSRRQREFAATVSQRTSRDFLAFTLFPGDKLPIQISTTVSREEIRRFDDFMSKMGANDATFLPPIAMIGCIDYGSVFGGDHYQTGFILDLHQFNPEMPGARFAIPIFQGTYPVDRLVLSHSMLGTGLTT